MIGITGAATIYSTNPNILEKFTSDNGDCVIKVINTSTKYINGESLIEYNLKFLIRMKRDPECKSLEDYTGKVSPFLTEHLESIVRSVQVYNIGDLGPPSIKHITEI